MGPTPEPAALTLNGAATSKLNGRGRLSISGNGNGSAHPPTPAVPVNRLNGTAKNAKPRALATV